MLRGLRAASAASYKPGLEERLELAEKLKSCGFEPTECVWIYSSEEEQIEVLCLNNGGFSYYVRHEVAMRYEGIVVRRGIMSYTELTEFLNEKFED